MIFQTDASLTGWGAVCNVAQTLGQWSQKERTLQINVLELLAIKLVLLSFTKGEKVKSIHFQINNKAALSYLLKMGEVTKNEHMIKLRKEIWHSKSQNFYHSRILAFTESKKQKKKNQKKPKKKTKKTPESSEWFLHPKVFQAVSRLLGSPTIDLLAF